MNGNFLKVKKMLELCLLYLIDIFVFFKIGLKYKGMLCLDLFLRYWII